MPDDLPWRPVADSFARRFAPPELYDPKKRREWKLGRHDGDRGPYGSAPQSPPFASISWGTASADAW
jgi:hypothetical protein